MNVRNGGLVGWLAVFLVGFAGSAAAEETPPEKRTKPEMLELSVRVVDESGKPVPKTTVTPWAIRSERGHGIWGEGEGDEETDLRVEPQAVVTDEQGMARIAYPVEHMPRERVRTTAVSLRVDHPRYAILDYVEVQVPQGAEMPQAVALTPGVPVEVRPLIDGQPADLDKIFAIWSDGRTWQPGLVLEKLPSGAIRIPAMRHGKNSVLLVRMEGGRATHFSRIVDFTVVPAAFLQFDVALRPSVRLTGHLSENVPRPVRRGRISVCTLNPDEMTFDRAGWRSWATVSPDGTFVIDSWPADERIQIIGLCGGYIAANGLPPVPQKNPLDPAEEAGAAAGAGGDADRGGAGEVDPEIELANELGAFVDGFSTPQIFESKPQESISLRMSPMGRCVVTALDPAGKPIAGLQVSSWPNVSWWNNGSQLYCDPLFSSQRALTSRDFLKSRDKSFSTPFQTKTDADGKATLELPAGSQDLVAGNDDYVLPMRGENQYVEVHIEAEKLTETTLRLQPRATEPIGQ